MNKKETFNTIAVQNLCCGDSISCSPHSVGRREFVKATGLTAAMLLAGRASVMAGPFSQEDFDQIIPSDKKLSKEWVESLYARGEALTASGDDLKYIGMPINGICTGQVYLGGDGQLWRWNLDGARNVAKENAKGPRFMSPDVAQSPISQGFALQVAGQTRSLDAKGFRQVTFTNHYPMATVDYADAACPVDVQLQAYTPFIPLNRDDSSYPVIVMRYTVTNRSETDQKVAIAGWIENISNKASAATAGTKLCAYRELDGISAVECSAKFGTSAPAESEVFADFEGDNYGDWTVEGTAFGNKPSTGADAEGVQKLSGMRGKGLANSWTGSDEPKGKLISPVFKIEKPYINFLIGGGNNRETLNASLWVNGRKVASAVGQRRDAMVWVSWPVAKFKGQQAHIEILDASSGPWGHIEVDQIEFSTQPAAGGAAAVTKHEKAADFGSLALGVLGSERPEIVDINRNKPGAAGVFASKSSDLQSGALSERAFKTPAFASLGRTISLKPGEAKTIAFALAWHYPNTQYNLQFGMRTVSGANHYATLWPSATDVAGAVAAREAELHTTTQTWADTWYDSTLPYWFLERTFVTLDCVQTQMAQRIAKGKKQDYYNFDEGVKCCPGNCTHVWHYAQGLARIFPQIERECRDKVEYGLGFDRQTGVMRHRYIDPKFGDAIDGNCGTILRVLRESQMTTDYSFLASIWDRVKLSMDHVIAKWDADEDGMLEGAQHNTLDEPWFGQVHWLINLYHAALKASAVMARQMKQPSVAARYEKIVAKGAPAMVDLLWNEEFGYFIHKPGAEETQKHGSTNGCHIDQILGDSWLWNVGIDPILPKDKIKRSLESLWAYNFTPNVGNFRKTMTEGRWYGAAGNAGLVMCSFPNGKIEPKSGKKNYAGYLNECMTGFEWQVAAHMIWEGMVEKGLAIGKAIHDRYLPKDRNPYNEIECSDHYSRAMASYGAYMAICGYRYDGPEGKLAFGPRMQQDDFRAGFTTAEGWGSFAQKVVDGRQLESIELRYGTLELRELAFDAVKGSTAHGASVHRDGKLIDASFRQEAGRYILSFAQNISLSAGQSLNIVMA